MQLPASSMVVSQFLDNAHAEMGQRCDVHGCVALQVNAPSYGRQASGLADAAIGGTDAPNFGRSPSWGHGAAGSLSFRPTSAASRPATAALQQQVYPFWRGDLELMLAHVRCQPVCVPASHCLPPSWLHWTQEQRAALKT